MASPGRKLGDGTVMVKASHGRKVLGIEIGRISLRNEAIRIGRISYHEYLNVSRRTIIERFALHGKNRRIGFE